MKIDDEFLENFLRDEGHSALANEISRDFVDRLVGQHADVALKAIVILLRTSYDHWFKIPNPDSSFSEYMHLIEAVGEALSYRESEG